jgi:hypothetical protein
MKIAVIGTGRHLREVLARTGFNDVQILSAAPDRTFDEATHTWLLRTGDGAEHRAQIVIDEQPAEVAGRPYLGVATHGQPNHFVISGPDHAGQARYVVECLRVLARSGDTRIEVRYSTQRVFDERTGGAADNRRAAMTIPWRRLMRKIGSAFDLSSHVGVADEIYDGQAVLQVGDRQRDVRVRLTGHLDPIDGRYHWQGTLFDALDDEDSKRVHTVGLRIGQSAAEARVTERSPWGTCSVSGVGAPPFPLDDVEVVVPRP